MKCQLPNCKREAYPGQTYCCSDHRDQAVAIEGGGR